MGAGTREGEKMKLKPCPFCGWKAGIERFRGGIMYIVYCKNIKCPADVSISGDTKEQVTELWNTRKGSDD